MTKLRVYKLKSWSKIMKKYNMDNGYKNMFIIAELLKYI